MIDRCHECQHVSVCKFKEEFKKLLDRFATDSSLVISEPFTLALTCKHFYTTTCTFRNVDGFGTSDWANTALSTSNRT